MRKFSHSSMSTFRRCRQRYFWSYVKNYATESGVGQLRGSASHAALAHWYGSAWESDEESLKVAAQFYSLFESNNNVNLDSEWELTEIVLRRYFEWARSHETIQEIIGLEQKFEIDMQGISLIGYIDGVVKSGGSIWLLENKFLKRAEVKHVDLDPQMSLYMLAAYKSGIDARGVLFNVIRVGDSGVAVSDPVLRVPVYRNVEGLSYIEQETQIQLNAMKKFHEEGGDVYRTCTKECSWDCGFYEACLSLNDCGNADKILSKFPVVPHEGDATQEKGVE